MVIGYEDIVYIRKIIKSIPELKSGEDLEKYTLKFKHTKSYENIIKKADILGITIYTYNNICVIPNVNSKEILVINNASEKFETPVKANQLFSDLNIGTIDVTDIDFSRTVEAKDLFAYCSCKEILMAEVNLSSAITIQCMCQSCEALVHIDLSDVNIEKVEDISYLFIHCHDLKCISTKGIKTGNLKNMRAMFQDCKSIKKINLSPFNTSNVTDISSICNGCEQCEHVMLANNNFDSLVDMSFAFNGCKKLNQVIFPNQELRQLRKMRSVFCNSNNLEIVSFDKAVISKDTDMWLLVYNCKSLCKVIFPSSILTNKQKSDMAFNDRNNIITKDAKVIIDKGLVSYINIISSKYLAKNIVFRTVNSIDAFKKKAEALNFKNVEFGMKSVNKKYIHSIDKVCLYIVAETDNSNTLYIVAEQKFSITNGERLFKGESGNACAEIIENICLDDVDFSDTDALLGCFSNMQQLRSISIKDKSFDNCTSITGIFSNCSKLRSVHLSNLKLPKVDFLIDIFKNCKNLEDIELNNIELPLSKSAINTFTNCEMLREIDLSTVTLGRIDYLIETFNKCIRLENIKMSHNIDASGLKYLNNTFAYCSNLENVDLTWVNWVNVESIKGIFNECKNLRNIELNGTNINTPKLTMIADAVNGCTKLRTRFLDIIDTKHIID